MNPFTKNTALQLAIIFLLSTRVAPAQTVVTVDELEQQINTLSRQKEDAAASILAHFQLTQRVSPARLARWQSRFSGKRVGHALLYLADASSIYDLPASDLPSAPPPDEPARAAILGRARQYIRTMRPHLPNFFAKRTVTTYQCATLGQIEAEERQLQLVQLTNNHLGFHSLGVVDPPRQLFLEDSAESTVTNRDGAEVQTLSAMPGKHYLLIPNSLVSYGEFGSILKLISPADADGSIAWHHWEQGSFGLLAVYRFSVRAGKSDFVVSSPMGNLEGLTSQDHLAYHGEIAVEPASGGVFRIAIVAEPSKHDPRIVTPGAMVVEYGYVEIGGKDYLCPLHAVAVYQFIDWDLENSFDPPRTLVNDVTFADYHLFRSEMRMLP